MKSMRHTGWSPGGVFEIRNSVIWVYCDSTLGSPFNILKSPFSLQQNRRISISNTLSSPPSVEGYPTNHAQNSL